MRRRRSPALPSAILLAILFAPHLKGQNVLLNPGFDIDLSGWESSCVPTCVSSSWSSQDASGSPSSGSALLNGTGLTGELHQVIYPVFEGVTYDFGATIRGGIPAAAGRVTVYWSSDNRGGGECEAGGSLLRVDATPTWSGTTWNALSVTVTPPKGAKCALFQLTAMGGVLSGTAYFDDAFFIRQNTTGSFYTVTPCRVVDTRDPDGPFGGPAFAPLTTRTFAIVGGCGIPSDATAVAANLTVTNATGVGHFVIYPAGTSPPSASTLNFSTSRTRANNAILALGVSGQIAVFGSLPFGGTADLILDVSGYFQ